MQLAGIISRGRFRSRLRNELLSSLVGIALQGENKFFVGYAREDGPVARGMKVRAYFSGEMTTIKVRLRAATCAQRRDSVSQYSNTVSKRTLWTFVLPKDPLTLLLSSLARFFRKLNDICRGTSAMKQTKCLGISQLRFMKCNLYMYVQKNLRSFFHNFRWY